MVQALKQLSIQSPGVQGLNSEISPFQQGLDFALRADNAVIDRVGRIAAREAFADYIKDHEISLAEGETYEIVRMEYTIADEQDKIQADEYNVSEYNIGEYNGQQAVGIPGTKILGIAGIGTPGFTDYDRYVGVTIEDSIIKEVPGIAPSNGVMHCQLVPFKDAIYVFSKGDPVMVYKDGVASKLSDDPDFLPPQDDTGVIVSEIDGDVACAAYGRLWVSGVDGDYDTVFWSDLLIPNQWYDGTASPADEQNTAGLIDVREYWPSGNDKIQGIAAHNGFLIIFGVHSILIYSGAQGNPAGEDGLRLQDAIRDVGLVNQDAMCNIGSDHFFVDSLGVRSLGRVVQEKSAPIAEPSLNVATVIRKIIADNRDTVRLSHLSSKTMVVCLFPKIREAYVFQLGQPGAMGGLRTTRWTDCDFYTGVTLQTDYRETELLGGRDGRGFLAYDGYVQPRPYVLRYESSVLLSGDALTQALVPKSISFSYHRDLVGSNPPNTLFCRWGFSSELMPFFGKVRPVIRKATAGGQFQTGKCNIKGSGDMMRVGFDFEIDGSSFAMQQISINTLAGRVFV